MAKKILIVCDTCEDPKRPTRPYSLVSEGRKKELDLCEEHGAPIEQFLEGTKARGRRAGSGRGANRVLTNPDDAPKTTGSKVKQTADA